MVATDKFSGKDFLAFAIRRNAELISDRGYFSRKSFSAARITSKTSSPNFIAFTRSGITPLCITSALLHKSA